MIEQAPSSLAGAELRGAIYGGRIFRFEACDASRALVAEVIALIQEELADPRRALNARSEAQLWSALDRIRSALREEERFRDAALAVMDACGLSSSARATAIDHLRLRAIQPDAHEKPEAAPAYFAHRDTWYANPYAQLNWWLPLYPVPVDRTIGFHPHLFDRPVRNDSHLFDYATFTRTVGWQKGPGNTAAAAAVYPRALEAITEEPVVCATAPAEILLFSAAQLHRTVPNRSREIRWSIDFRTVDLADHAQGLGAPNVDGFATGSSVADYAHTMRPR